MFTSVKRSPHAIYGTLSVKTELNARLIYIYRRSKKSVPSRTKRSMELSPSQKIFASYTARDNCTLRRAERTKKNRDLFYRRGSKILPDYFPPDTHSKNLGFHQTTVPRQRRFLVKEYSFEAQEIAESWMMYFGIKTCESTWHTKQFYERSILNTIFLRSLIAESVFLLMDDQRHQCEVILIKAE